MSTTAARGRRRLALVAIVLALLAVALAWSARPREHHAIVKEIANGPFDLPGRADQAIAQARRERATAVVLKTRFTAQGGDSLGACPPAQTKSIDAAAATIDRAPLPVTVVIEADPEAGACAGAFHSRFTRCATTLAARDELVSVSNVRYIGTCITPSSASGSRPRVVLLLLAAALLVALAWALLRGPRPPVPTPPVRARPEPAPPGRSPTEAEVPAPVWSRGARLAAAHPLAGRLRQPQYAEVHSVFDPAGFVAFEGGLWRAAWAGSPPAPGVGTRVLVQYDERSARLVAFSAR